MRATVLSITVFIQACIAGYHLVDDYNPNNFFDKFSFFTEPDPTNGFVQYVDKSTASSGGLISQDGNSVYMGVDNTNMAPNGRSSVRITSNKVYNHGLIILDLEHMPVGCGTWPAFWTVGPTWPDHGEIDIIEGVNTQDYNAMTLHTGPDCSIANDNDFMGTISTDNCDVTAYGQPENAGCSIDNSDPITYGAGLNSNNGGVYATEWHSGAITIWFFPRGHIPSDIASGKPHPGKWGKPFAKFSGDCDIDSSFNSQQIVFDTTFCGDWAGGAWGSDSTCSAMSYSCDDYVANNPQAFKDAYWKINSLKVYQTHGSSKSAPKPAVKHTDAAPTGIDPSLPADFSSLAPIPISTQNVDTTFVVAPSPTPQASNTWNDNWEAPASPTPVASGGSAAAAAAAWAANTAGTPAGTPAPSPTVWGGEPVESSWVEGSAGVPSAAIAQPTPTGSYYRERRSQHIARHKRYSPLGHAHHHRLR